MTGAQFIAPLNTVDVNTELICTCHVALLPFIAVHRCLAPMSMQQLWALHGQLLVDSGHMVEMGALLDWICVASVKPAAQALPLIQMAAPPVASLVDGSLLGYLSQVVQQWLLGWLTAPMPPQLAAPAPQVRSILQQMGNDQQVHHQAAEAREAGCCTKNSNTTLEPANNGSVICHHGHHAGS